MFRRALGRMFCIACLTGGWLWGQIAFAGVMTLTPAGVADGFTLTTFADGIPATPFSGVGPLGVAFTSTGSVMVASYDTAKNIVFSSNSDGQHYLGAASSTSTYNGPAGLAIVGNNIYETIQGEGRVIQVDSQGDFVKDIKTGLSSPTGIVANPVNGHLFVSGVYADAVMDINPLGMTATLFSAVQFDGLAITADGSTLYGANPNGHIQGYDTTTGQLVYDSGYIPGGIDGSALGYGTLAGNIFVNLNNGTLLEINLATNLQTVIGTGGSRGDFVQVAPDGTLYITQSNEILHLTAGAGGGFGSPPATPEPGTVTLISLGAVGMAYGAYRRRRGKKPDQSLGEDSASQSMLN